MFKDETIKSNGRYLSLKDEYLDKLMNYCKGDDELMMFLRTRILKNEDGEFLCDENKAILAQIKAFIPDLPLVNYIVSEIERLENIKLKDTISSDKDYLNAYTKLLKYVVEENYNWLVWNIVYSILREHTYARGSYYSKESDLQFRISKKLYKMFNLHELLDSKTISSVNYVIGAKNV